jgi:hypothetical protein
MYQPVSLAFSELFMVVILGKLDFSLKIEQV